jgi:hypothetical protein
MPMSAGTERTFRASTSSYVVLGGAFGGMFAFTIYATFFTHPSFWKAAASVGAALMLVLVWLAVFEIRITDDELRFRSLFGGVRRMSLDDVQKVRLGFRLRSTGGPLQLVVEGKDRETASMSINAKVFSRDAIRTVLKVGERFGTADSRGLADGVVAREVRKRGDEQSR